LQFASNDPRPGATSHQCPLHEHDESILHLNPKEIQNTIAATHRVALRTAGLWRPGPAATCEGSETRGL